MAIMSQSWGEWYNTNMKDYVPSDPKIDYWARKIASILTMAKHPIRKPTRKK